MPNFTAFQSANAMKILVVEDEHDVADFLQKSLKENGFEVTLAFDGKMAWDFLSRSKFDLVLLDVMVPELNGMQLLERMRTQGHSAAVIMLTALGTTDNVISGLEAGADDYLVKPFKFQELLARIKAVMRRKQERADMPSDAARLAFEDIQVDDSAKLVKRAGEKINLTATEYKLLLCFMKNINRVLSREEILSKVWGIDFDLSTNIVDVYVNYLRKKVEKKPWPPVIHTVFGMGYVMRKTES